MSALKKLPARLRWFALLLSAAAAALILAQCWGILIPSAQEVFVTLISETAGEICLCDVVVDGENIPVGQAEVVENSGWLYREQYDNFVIWPEEDGVENRLTFRFFAEEVHIGFPYTPYAGSVTIECSTGGGGTYDLRCAEWAEGEEVQYADFPFDCRRSPTQIMLCGGGIFLLLTGALFPILLCAANLFWKKFQPLLSRVSFSAIGEKNRARLSKIFSAIREKLRRLFPPSPKGSSPDRKKSRQNPDQQIPLGRKILLAISSLPSSGRRPVSLILLLAVYCLLFFTSPQISPDGFTTVLLLLLTIVAYLCLTSGLARRLLAKYRTRGKTALAAVIALYASLASFGQRLFLDGNTRMHISVERMIYLILGIIWFVPVIYLLLLGLELLASSCGDRAEPCQRRLVFWKLLALLCLCQAVILWSFWPGGYSTDSIDLIYQAMEPGRMSDWHPALNAILYRVILTICPHAGALVVVQMFFFALLCTKFLMLGYDYGVSFRTLAVLGAVFSLLPNQAISGITPLKDNSYTLALLWAAYLLVRLALNLAELRRWQFLLSLSLALFLIYGFRHNGVVPFAALLLLFVWITVRHYRQVKLRLAAAALCSLLMIAVYKGPVFSLLNVSTSTGMSPYTTMLCAVASCINKDLPLSEESAAIMESILPLDQWGKYYNRYSGHDPYYWERGELAEEYPFDPSHVTAKEAFTVYLEALCKYPDVVIKDRLDGMDLLWDVRQPPDSFNTRGFTDLIISEEDRVADCFGSKPLEYGVRYYNDSFLAEAYRSTMQTDINSVFDMLLWRAGAYLILLLTLGLFWWGNRMKKLLWAAVPLLGQLAGLALVLYHQSYRYVSAVQILTLALVFCTVFLRNAEAGCGPVETEKERILSRG